MNHAAHPRRVLLVSLFHPELVRGGAQQICYDLFNALKDTPGIEPFLLASINSSYPALFKVGARITGFDGRANEFLYLSTDYDELWHKTSSHLHLEAFAEFLREIAPDVVHFHHFYSMGIDLLTLTREILPNCRIIFTFHEFLAICQAGGHMVRRTDHSLCTHATPVRCHQCFPERSPEQFLLRKMWFMRHLAAVDFFTCPSAFMLTHYIRWGLPAHKLGWVTNGQVDYARNTAAAAVPAARNRFGFFGQLLDIKGVVVLLDAVDLLRGSGFTNFSVDLNGDNLRYASAKVRNQIESFLAAEQALPPQARIVTNNGSYQLDQIGSRMARVDWCVVPSLWWEAFGLVISEAFMFAKPVICSNAGAMRERVADNISGLHFELGDPRSLAQAMRRACTEDGLWDRLSANTPVPPPLEAMIDGYLEVYRAETNS